LLPFFIGGLSVQVRRFYHLSAITELFVLLWEVKEEGTISLRRNVEGGGRQKGLMSLAVQIQLETPEHLLHPSKTTVR